MRFFKLPGSLGLADKKKQTKMFHPKKSKQFILHIILLRISHDKDVYAGTTITKLTLKDTGHAEDSVPIRHKI